MERLRTKKECATLLCVSTRTIERQVLKGMPHIKVGNRIRFDMDDVLAWIKERSN